jgi:hypothetical protein
MGKFCSLFLQSFFEQRDRAVGIGRFSPDRFTQVRLCPYDSMQSGNGEGNGQMAGAEDQITRIGIFHS